MAYRQEQIKPYSRQGEKTTQVEAMFDNIASTYDLLNHLLSWGIDRRWRNKAIDSLRPFAPQHILDIATGTGDFAILAARRLRPQQVVGADISEGMIEVARQKVERMRLSRCISLERQDCTALSYPDCTFDAVTVAYGARNFAHLDAALQEMCRVLRAGGHLLLLELAAPHRFPMKQLFRVYSHIAMPLAGWMVSRDSRAYSYLPATMEAFPQGEVMQGILERAGYTEVQWKRFTFGICTMYLARKPVSPISPA